MTDQRQAQGSKHPGRGLQKASFYLLLAAIVAMLGYLSLHFDTQWDWSDSRLNSLSESSERLIDKLEGDLLITSFAPQHRELRRQIKAVIAPYQHYSERIRFQFVDPAQQPAQVRELGIRASGELRIEYNGHGENLTTLDENHISQAIQRLLARKQQWIIGIEGHGERALLGKANYDLGLFGAELKRVGYSIQNIRLTQSKDIPVNTSVLLIAGPQSAYLPGESEILQRYIEQGGNLIWLADPDNISNLGGTREQLDLSFLPGTVVDAGGAKLGLDSPAIIAVSNYPDHPVTHELNQLSLLPHASAMEIQGDRWQASPILQSAQQSWNETSDIKGQLALNPEQWETPGPLNLGLVLTRQLEHRQQRVIVIGDGDFLSNSYLGNAGNLQLGLNIIRWLVEDGAMLDIPARMAQDAQITFSETKGALLGFWFLLGAPLLLAATGVLLTWRRRQRR